MMSKGETREQTSKDLKPGSYIKQVVVVVKYELGVACCRLPQTWSRMSLFLLGLP